MQVTIRFRFGRIPLKAGEKFAIVIKVTTPNGKRPIAIEYAADKATEGVDLSDGKVILVYMEMCGRAQKDKRMQYMFKGIYKKR